MSIAHVFPKPLAVAATALALLGPVLDAEARTCDHSAAFSGVSGLTIDAHGREKHNAGWAVYIDNDALTPLNEDEDYTGGLAVTLAGRRAVEWRLSLDTPLGWLDRGLGLAPRRCGEAFTMHSLQTSVVAFTPGEIEIAEPIRGDRPYASLVQLVSGRIYVRDRDIPVYQTSFAVGLLGLELARAVQNGIHKLLGNKQARGWDNQISDGGEPTLRYAVARQDLLASNFDAGPTEYELKSAVGAGVGYVTDINAALSFRWGRINTPWWSFPPERAEYIAEPAPVIGGNDIRPGSRERYVWGGGQAARPPLQRLSAGPVPRQRAGLSALRDPSHRR